MELLFFKSIENYSYNFGKISVFALSGISKVSGIGYREFFPDNQIPDTFANSRYFLVFPIKKKHMVITKIISSLIVEVEGSLLN